MNLRFYFLGVLFLIFSCARNTVDLKIASFNIRYDSKSDGVNQWKNRKELVFDFFKENKIAIAGIQEAQHHQLMDILMHVPQFDFCGKGRDDGLKGGEFSAILYNKTLFEKIEEGTFWLSETPQVAGSVGWDADYPRVVTWAKFKMLHSQEEFYFLNTHFDHRGVEARIHSAQQLNVFIEHLPESLPIFLTGDFNTSQNGEPFRILNKKLNCANLLGESKNEITFNAYEKEKYHRQIDFIFTDKNTKTLHFEVQRIIEDQLYISDHFPIIAQVTF